MSAVVPDLAVALINFNTASRTVRCLESLAGLAGIARIVVLDNASSDEDFDRLRVAADRWPGRVSLIRSSSNLGFAAGSNLLVGHLLSDQSIDEILLLNNDAVALPPLIEVLTVPLRQSDRVGMVGGRVHRLAEPEMPDSLGLTLYACLVATNRRTTSDPFLGPTGGCCLLSRILIEDVIRSTGHLFDPDYFCYWEDTDLVLRAILLGYEPAYIDTLVALHEGQASTGGKFNTFIAYHGLRNAIWTTIKCMPAAVILLRGAHFLLVNAMSVARFVAAGEWRLLFRIYRDALRGLPRCWRQRRRIMANRRIESDVLLAKISSKFYESGYMAAAAQRMLLGKS